MARIGALFVLALVIAVAMAARTQGGEIYKCVDDRGRPLYTSDKRDTAGKKCETVAREVNVAPAQGAKPGAKSQAGFPKESASDRATSKSKQRETIEREMTQEQQLLVDAKRKLA